MRELKMKLCVLMLPLVVSACASTPTVQAPCVKPPSPPAWAMEKAQDLQQMLNSIITVSEVESTR
nr:Rz1 family lipoprotein [Escherichia coli]